MTDITAPWTVRRIARGQIRLWNTLWKWRARLTKKFDKNDPLALFLEDTVEGLFDIKPNAVAVIAVNEDENIAGTNYMNCCVDDKWRMMLQIMEDIIIEVVANNSDVIREMLLNGENDDVDGEDDEIDE